MSVFKIELITRSSDWVSSRVCDHLTLAYTVVERVMGVPVNPGVCLLNQRLKVRRKAWIGHPRRIFPWQPKGGIQHTLTGCKPGMNAFRVRRMVGHHYGFARKRRRQRFRQKLQGLQVLAPGIQCAEPRIPLADDPEIIHESLSNAQRGFQPGQAGRLGIQQKIGPQGSATETDAIQNNRFVCENVKSPGSVFHGLARNIHGCQAPIAPGGRTGHVTRLQIPKTACQGECLLRAPRLQHQDESRPFPGLSGPPGKTPDAGPIVFVLS